MKLKFMSITKKYVGGRIKRRLLVKQALLNCVVVTQTISWA